MAPHLDIGKTGEALAVDHLRAKGLQLLHRNWRHGSRHELDLVMRDTQRPQSEVVIVEVKTLTAFGPREPWQAFTPAKRKALRAAAEAYCCLERVDAPVRFDVVAVTLGAAGGTPVIEHFVDVRLD